MEAVRGMAADLDGLPDPGVVSEAAVCYLWACAGIDVLGRVRQILDRNYEPVVVRLTACWILALCHDQIASPASTEVRQALITEVLKLLAESLECTPLGRTLALQTFLILQYRGEEIEDLAAPLLLDSTAPWGWKLESIHGDVSCPAFNLALLVNAVAKCLEGGVFS